MPGKEHVIAILFFVKENTSCDCRELELLLDAGLSLKPAYLQINNLRLIMNKIDDLALHHCRFPLYDGKSVKVTLLILTSIYCALRVFKTHLYCKLRSWPLIFLLSTCLTNPATHLDQQGRWFFPKSTHDVTVFLISETSWNILITIQATSEFLRSLVLQFAYTPR